MKISESKIFVTGLGIISGIGENPEEIISNLEANKSSIGPIEIVETEHKNEFLVSEIKKTNQQLMEQLGLNFSQKNEYTRTSLLALIAVGKAFRDANIDLKDGFRTGLISATTVGGMDISEKYYRDPNNNNNNNFIRTHHCGDSTEKCADFYGISDFYTTVSTACSSAANAAMLGAKMIRAGLLDRVIVGGSDALAKFTINGFKSLMILDNKECRPFDESRSGLNLGEAAAYIVLSNEKAAQKAKQSYCYLSGWANANDAYHQTASSPEGNGAFLAMKKALEVAKIEPKDVSYINMHGTGTPNNDLTEGTASLRLFGDNLPPFSSSKSFTGHTLAAAGAIESVFSVMSIKDGLIFPNYNFKTPIPELNIVPETLFQKGKNINHVLSNSFGFGGNSSSLVFSAI